MGARRKDILNLATTNGAVFFRRFPTAGTEALDEIVKTLGVANFTDKQSLSNAVRFNHTKRVFSANEAPPKVGILFHQQMAQTSPCPKRIMFCCETADEPAFDVPWRRGGFESRRQSFGDFADMIRPRPPCRRI